MSEYGPGHHSPNEWPYGTTAPQPKPSESVSRVEYYLSTDRKWHWRVRAANGKIFDASSQGFWSKWNAKRNYRRGLQG